MIRPEVAEIRNNPFIEEKTGIDVKDAFDQGKSIDYVAKLDNEINNELNN